MEIDFNNFENIIKSKYIDFNLISFDNNNQLLYNNNIYYIQTPIFKDYNILNYNNKTYIQIFVDNKKLSHVKFLNLINTIEVFLKKKDIIFKSQIIEDNNISIKIKYSDKNKIFNKNHNEIEKLSGKSIILLINFNINCNFYSIVSNQILEI